MCWQIVDIATCRCRWSTVNLYMLVSSRWQIAATDDEGSIAQRLLWIAYIFSAIIDPSPTTSELPTVRCSRIMIVCRSLGLLMHAMHMESVCLCLYMYVISLIHNYIHLYTCVYTYMYVCVSAQDPLQPLHMKHMNVYMHMNGAFADWPNQNCFAYARKL